MGSTIYEQRDALLKPCEEWVEGQAWLMTITVVASVLVIIVNFALRTILIKLAEKERHQSLSSLQSSIVSKVFVAQFANTAIVILLVNAHFFNGVFSDFTSDWYDKVGVALILTMLINVFSPHLLAVLMVRVTKLRQHCCTKRVKQQDT